MGEFVAEFDGVAEDDTEEVDDGLCVGLWVALTLNDLPGEFEAEFDADDEGLLD